MTEIKIHWSFWVICVVALIWNVMGSINFIMQMNPDILANYPEAAKSLVASRPLWATGAFAIAAFGGALGDILLILKKAASYYLFIASFFGVIVANIHTFQVSSAIDIWVGSLMSLVIAAFIIWYSKLVKRKGWINYNRGRP
jgi:hypothetical protein